jgi:hypothetical protein
MERRTSSVVINDLLRCTVGSRVCAEVPAAVSYEIVSARVRVSI